MPAPACAVSRSARARVKRRAAVPRGAIPCCLQEISSSWYTNGTVRLQKRTSIMAALMPERLRRVIAGRKRDCLVLSHGVSAFVLPILDICFNLAPSDVSMDGK